MFDSDARLMTADELREITITPDELYERKKNGIIDSFMTSMQKLAMNSAKTSFSSQFGVANIEANLLDDVEKTFNTLGYKTSRGTGTIGNEETVILTVDWSLN